MQKSISPEQEHFILKADGYLDLGMKDSARDELNKTEKSARHSVLYNEVKLRLLTDEEQWQDAAVIARTLCSAVPEDAGSWIRLAYTLRRASGIDEARGILEEARIQFPDEPIIPFNLACYACRQNKLDEARALLQKAISLYPDCLEMALADPDLEPLWDELEETC